MTELRKKNLQELVNQRFRNISPRAARSAYVDGFPFGIAVPKEYTSEERAFLEARAKAALDAKLMPKGEQ
jgi:hypothetical protein